jgi:hypothetical protein
LNGFAIQPCCDDRDSFDDLANRALGAELPGERRRLVAEFRLVASLVQEQDAAFASGRADLQI